MIDISALRIGDVVRNIGSGTAYQVTREPAARIATKGGLHWVAGLTRDIVCDNPQEWELIAQGPFREVKRTGDSCSITWTTRIGDRELSRTVSAPTADACIGMMNRVEEYDRRRSMGIPVDDDGYRMWCAGEFTRAVESEIQSMAASLNQAHNLSANVGSQG